MLPLKQIQNRKLTGTYTQPNTMRIRVFALNITFDGAECVKIHKTAQHSSIQP